MSKYTVCPSRIIISLTDNLEYWDSEDLVFYMHSYMYILKVLIMSVLIFKEKE